MHGDSAPSDLASGLRRSALSVALIALAALASLGAIGCLVALGALEGHRAWGASGAVLVLAAEFGVLAGLAMIVRAIVLAHARRRKREEEANRPPEPPASPVASAVAPLLEALGARRALESSPLLTLGALSVAAVVVIGPGRLARFAVRGMRLVRTLDTLVDAARTASGASSNGRMRSESRS